MASDSLAELILNLYRTPAVPLPEEVGQDRLHVGAGSRVPTLEPRDRSPDRNQARDRDQRDPVAEVNEQLNEAAAVDDLVVVVVAAAVQVRMMDSNHCRALRSFKRDS